MHALELTHPEREGREGGETERGRDREGNRERGRESDREGEGERGKEKEGERVCVCPTVSWLNVSQFGFFHRKKLKKEHKHDKESVPPGIGTCRIIIQ